MAKTILNFHFDYLNPSLRTRTRIVLLMILYLLLKNLFQGPSLKSETVLESLRLGPSFIWWIREGKGWAGCTFAYCTTTTTTITTTSTTTTTIWWIREGRLHYYCHHFYYYYFHLRAGKGWAGCTSGLSADQAFWVLREEVSADSAQCTTATTMYYWYFNYF